MDINSKIYIAGHRGLVGSALLRNLKEKGYENLVLKTRQELDLLDQQAVKRFFEEEKPEYVIMAAAKVGGIMANNTYPADFINENLLVQNNVIHNAHLCGVKKLLFLGSVCIYPKFAQIPIKEEYLLTGALEPTNEPYAIAKIAGMKMCQSYNRQYGTNFIGTMPTNLYGPGDNFDLKNSHVLPALIRKFHEAKINGQDEVSIWGSGIARREFLHVDDMAEGCIFLLENFNPTKEQHEKGEMYLNLGSGEDIAIKDLAEMIKDIVGFKGKLTWDTTKPDGTPKRILDTTKINELGWQPKIKLEEGIRKTYEWYKQSF
jgi:GDP-L-fucose synthase